MPHTQETFRRDGRRRVVITGIGVVSPIGSTPESYWQSLLMGRSGVSEIDSYRVSSFDCRIAAQVRDFRFPEPLPGRATRIPPDRRSQMAIVAAEKAVADAGLDFSAEDPRGVAIYLGAGEGTLNLYSFARMVSKTRTGNRIPETAFLECALRDLDPEESFEVEAGLCAMHLASLYNAQGPNLNCLTACAASSQALGEAFRRIQYGEADIIVSGGSHSMIQPLDVLGFISLNALSTRNDEPERASRPFDADRDGFVLGEGAGILILEELTHALRRKVRIHAELLGYGSTADSYRVTDTHPEARGAIAAMSQALQDAGLEPSDIDYINAHGTSTVENDATETLAIKKVFGTHARRIPISSTKSMIGHLIAAAGVVELVACICTLQNGIAHPTINYETPDPLCDLDYIPNEPRELKVKTIISNSFGFGGQNVSLVIKGFPS